MLKIDIRCKTCGCVMEHQTNINPIEVIDILVVGCQNENCKDNKEHEAFVTANIELEKENEKSKDKIVQQQDKIEALQKTIGLLEEKT
jgi:hypothetical protein